MSHLGPEHAFVVCVVVGTGGVCTGGAVLFVGVVADTAAGRLVRGAAFIVSIPVCISTDGNKYGVL